MKDKKVSLENWKPRTEIGRLVKKGEITNIDEIIDKGNKIMETEIVDFLLPDLESDFMLIGQAKGKFGGGQRRLFRQTQKKTKEGNVPSFATFGVVGNKDGYVGVSMAKSKETVPARDKSIRLAKLNLIKVRRGCGSWQCNCATPHSIPFTVSGRCGSVEITLMPAPKGTGLCIEKELQKMVGLSGIKDIWSRTKGHTKTKINLIYACFEAFKKLMETKITKDDVKHLGILEGKLPKKVKEELDLQLNGEESKIPGVDKSTDQKEVTKEKVKAVPKKAKKEVPKETPKKEEVKDDGK